MPSSTDIPLAETARPTNLLQVRSGFSMRLVIRLLVVAMVALNGLWVWGDWSPSKMKAIDALIKKGRLEEAELALRQRLRWASSDGDARLTLARISFEARR